MTRRYTSSFFEVPERLAGRAVIVAGGGSGAGAAIAHELAVEGARVAVLDASCAAAEATARRIRAIGGEALAIVADATSEPQARAAVGAAREGLGALDGLVICHAPSLRGSLHDLPLQTWQRDVERGLRGTLLMMRLALPSLRERGFGNIVCVASVPPDAAASASWQAMQWSLLGLCDSLRTTLEADRIQVLAVLVGARCDGALQAPPSLQVACADDPLGAASTVAEALAGPRVPVPAALLERFAQVRARPR